jgi:hypothetical protein
MTVFRQTLLVRRAFSRFRASLPRYSRRVQVYAVVSDSLREAIELFIDREDADRVVADWDRDEPERAGEPHVEDPFDVRNLAELGGF